MATANELLRDSYIQHQTYLLRYSSYVRNRINSILDATDKDIRLAIINGVPKNPELLTPAQWKKFRKIQEEITKIRSVAWQQSSSFWINDSAGLSVSEAAFTVNAITAASPVLLETVLPNASQLRAIATSRPFQGKLLRDWARTMQQNDITRISSAIQIGMVQGETHNQIASRIFGQEQFGFSDGVLNATKNEIQSVTRTAVQHIANAAREMFYADNSDIVEEEYFVATLDAKTTIICMANDGKTFPRGKGPQPPLHWNCRSVRVALLTNSLAGERPAKPVLEQELLDNYAKINGISTVSSRDDLPRGYKTSFDKWSAREIRKMIGTVPASTNYNTWLANQSNAFQNETLGITKAKLYRDGNLTLDKFIDRAGNELTLRDLAIKNSQAFIDAGLDPQLYK